MLSLEIIIVLGVLYTVLMYATWKTQRAKSEEPTRPKVREPETAPRGLAEGVPTGAAHKDSKSRA